MSYKVTPAQWRQLTERRIKIKVLQKERDYLLKILEDKKMYLAKIIAENENID